jgi:histidinol-phosphate aminotransferase
MLFFFIITLGNGSNDILELLARISLCHASDEVIFSQYAFVVYPLVTQALGAKAGIFITSEFHNFIQAQLAL